MRSPSNEGGGGIDSPEITLSLAPAYQASRIKHHRARRADVEDRRSDLYGTFDKLAAVSAIISEARRQG